MYYEKQSKRQDALLGSDIYLAETRNKNGKYPWVSVY